MNGHAISKASVIAVAVIMDANMIITNLILVVYSYFN